MKIDQSLLNTIYDKFNSFNIDPYLLQNHKDLFNLFYMVDTMTDWNNYSDLSPLQKQFSKKATLRLASKFLYSLNSQYKTKFIIDYAKNKLTQVNITSGKYIRDLSLNCYEIFYPNDSNINDFSALIHEYIHHLAAKFPKLKNDTSSYNVYSETLSILGELKSLDFLEQYGFPITQINIYKSYIRKLHQNNLNSFLFAEPLLDIYLSGQKLNEEIINELLNSNSQYKLIGKYGVINNIYRLIEDDLAHSLSYKHPLGMIKAASMHQDRISNKDFSKLIDTINLMEINDFEMMLPQKSKIELANDTIKEFSFKKVR